MHPIAFSVGGHPVRFSGLIYLLAIAVAGLHAYRVARRRGWDVDRVLPGVAIVVAAAYLGARFHGAMLDWEIFTLDPVAVLAQSDGLSYFGGLLAGSLAFVVYLRWARVPVGQGTDAFVPLAPVLYALFRIGCFLNGDDYGRPSALPWAMAFPEGSPPTLDPVHPVQLYEVAMMLPVILAIRRSGRRSAAPGLLTFDVVALMGAERLLAELWRLPPAATPAFLDPQWIAAGQILAGVAGHILLSTRVRSPVG
ncbi:MAG: prolipoprotein diacylglyceryl transferase [Gemmatimonadaceae bacterium]|nr:prolipoprotein diacylglyceryl transferase [Gemmatimonadaceae bacterium]